MHKAASGLVWLAGALIAAFGGPVLADDTASMASALLPQFQTVLAAKPDCTELTDSCVVCKKDGAGWACSVPGIACQPQAAVCSVPKP